MNRPIKNLINYSSKTYKVSENKKEVKVTTKLLKGGTLTLDSDPIDNISAYLEGIKNQVLNYLKEVEEVEKEVDRAKQVLNAELKSLSAALNEVK